MYETSFHTIPPPDSPRQSEIIKENMIKLAKKLPVFAACNPHFFCLDIFDLYKGFDILSLFTNKHPQFSLCLLHQHPTPSFTKQLISRIQDWISSKLSGTEQSFSIHIFFIITVHFILQRKCLSLCPVFVKVAITLFMLK